MSKVIKNLIIKNILKILIIYRNSISNHDLIFKNHIDQTIYFEIEYLIKLVKERRNEYV